MVPQRFPQGTQPGAAKYEQIDVTIIVIVTMNQVQTAQLAS